MSVSEQITRINNEVASQEELIAQISAAIEGKAVGEGGGAETCTVTVSTNKGLFAYILFTCYENNEITNYVTGTLLDGAQLQSITVENVICGSTIGFGVSTSTLVPAWTLTGGIEYISGDTSNSTMYAPYVFKAPITADIHGIIEFRDDD